MPNNIDNAVRAAVRSLKEVVGPAVDSENPLAQEQVQLVANVLDFLSERLPYMNARDRREMTIYADTATFLIDDAHRIEPELAAAIGSTVDIATALAGELEPRVQELRDTSDRLATLLSELVRDAADADEVTRRRIETTVVRGSKRLLDLQRSWFLPTGFEPNPAAVVELDDILSQR